MDTQSSHHPALTPDHSRRGSSRKVRKFAKILLTLLFIGLVFGAGLAVGRGNIHVNGLSLKVTVASSNKLNYSSVDDVYSSLANNFDGTLNNTQLIDGAKSGLVAAAGDPYTEYFNPKAAKSLNDTLAGQFSGIGAELGTDSDSNIIIISPIDGFPAQKAGIKPKDIIAAVNGQSTSGMTVDSVVNKIRGPVNTKVTLTVVRGSAKPIDITITRQTINIPSVKWQEDGNIGYIKISQFTNDTTKLATQAANEFKAKGVKAVVLDLRGNPGGYLDSAVQISSLWLDKGKTVVSERRGSTVIDSQTSTGSDTLKGLPTVVLIDAGSASASEITAGALHDNGAAQLVGEKSFGKGSVQEVENFPDGSELKVTIAHWYTPNGKNIDKQGITPGTVVAISDAQSQAGQDPQKDKAYQILQSQIH